MVPISSEHSDSVTSTKHYVTSIVDLTKFFLNSPTMKHKMPELCKTVYILMKRLSSDVQQGFMQDQIIASHTCFGGQMDPC